MMSMDKKELEGGMKDAKNESEEKRKGAEGGEGEEWAPSLDWILGSVGPFFNNNRGLGELLLDKLNEHGVNTEGAALAGLVDVLQQFNREYKEIGEALGQNLDRIEELSSQSEDLAQAVSDLVKGMGAGGDDGASMALDSIGGDMPPPEGAAGAMPPEGMEGGAPPMDMGGAPMDMGGAPPIDMGAGAAPPVDMWGAPPVDMGGAPMDMDPGAPPAGMGAAPGMGTLSDESVKDVKKYVISDERMKDVAGRVAAAWAKRKAAARPKAARISASIIDACSRRD